MFHPEFKCLQAPSRWRCYQNWFRRELEADIVLRYDVKGGFGGSDLGKAFARCVSSVVLDNTPNLGSTLGFDSDRSPVESEKLCSNRLQKVRFRRQLIQIPHDLSCIE
jgi:hypothetical protein